MVLEASALGLWVLVWCADGYDGCELQGVPEAEVAEDGGALGADGLHVEGAEAVGCCLEHDVLGGEEEGVSEAPVEVGVGPEGLDVAAGEPVGAGLEVVEEEDVSCRGPDAVEVGFEAGGELPWVHPAG